MDFSGGGLEKSTMESEVVAFNKPKRRPKNTRKRITAIEDDDGVDSSPSSPQSESAEPSSTQVPTVADDLTTEPIRNTYPLPSAALVRIECSSEAGRYIVANREISPGEIVLEQEPYGAVLLDASTPLRCDASFALPKRGRRPA